jgi:GNAT superfamily N-acetyltransferase
VELVIRAALPDDALAVAQVHVRAWQRGYRGLVPDAYLDGLSAEDRAARYTFGVSDPDRPHTQVAIAGGALAGFATTGPASDLAGAGELLALHVDPERWGTGVGRALIAAARARLATRFAHAVLWVLDGNARASRFYAGDGWVPDGTRRDATVWGITVPELRWCRALRA